MSEVQDTIIKEVTLKASQEKVYNAISDPSQVIKWFPDAVEGSYEVGSQPIFDFGTDGRAEIYIVEATPNSYFSYRWVPGLAPTGKSLLETQTTLVEFIVEDMGEETKLTIKESGFASFPVEYAEKWLGENTGGWDYMANRIQELFTAE